MVGEKVLGSAMMSMVVHEEGTADPPAGLKSTVPSLVCNVGGYNNQQSDDAGPLDHGSPEAAAAHGAAGDHDHHVEAHEGSSKQFMSSGALVPPPVSRETVHRVGQDSWWEVGFHFIAAVNNAFILGYPALIMAYLGWATGSLCLIGGGVVSFYNNCLLGSLHETGGKRHIRYRDLAGHIYGRGMYRLTWFVQYFNLSIANVGTIILAGEALKAIWAACSSTDNSSNLKLATWIVIAGVCFALFAFMVPTLHALRFFSTCSLLLSLIYTCIAIALAFSNGLKDPPRDYSLLGTKADRTFHAIGALATIAFAYNTGILPEMQATIRQPSTTNIYKALGMQFTVGTFPFLVLTFVGYWAYGSKVQPYLLLSLHGPKSLITIANSATFLQALVCLHIYATPMYEFMDTYFARTMDESDWSVHRMLVRFITRGTYITISTFLGALLPFFGDFITFTGAMACFPLESGIIHHMYLKVKGKGFSKWRLAWHWFIVVLSGVLTVATCIAAVRYIISDSLFYHAFADIQQV
ncbi:hypothetical protein CY35_14G080600 [Sphagnum magellanicum]|nr:hypothetical protein CY35_14G080600 [Sphagnum magellanicum]